MQMNLQRNTRSIYKVRDIRCRTGRPDARIEREIRVVRVTVESHICNRRIDVDDAVLQSQRLRARRNR